MLTPFALQYITNSRMTLENTQGAVEHIALDRAGHEATSSNLFLTKKEVVQNWEDVDPLCFPIHHQLAHRMIVARCRVIRDRIV